MRADAKKLLRSFESAKSARQSLDNLYQEIANLVLPTRQFTFKSEPGQRRRPPINDTAQNANKSLASALHGFLFNPLIRWFGLAAVGDDEVDEDAQLYMYDSTSRMLDYLNSTDSGFATQSFETALDLGAFGISPILVRETPSKLSFQARQLVNFYIVGNDEGELIETYRSFELTAREVVVKFDKKGPRSPTNKGPSPKTKKKAESTDNENEKIKIVHAVYKRNNLDPVRRDGPNKAWASVYIEVDEKHIISESGFDDSPYLLPRWSKTAEDIYGNSPSMDVLPTIKLVNKMETTVIEAGELATSPPIIVTSGSLEGKSRTIRTRPRSLIHVRAGFDAPKPLLSGSRPDIGDEMLSRREAKIERAFFLDNFKLPTSEAGEGQTRMTATEIIARRQEGLLMASPILSRLYQEWLNPVIVRLFKWMRKTGRLLPPPESFAGRAMTVAYKSPMALSQKASESQAFILAMTTAESLIAIDPTVVHNVDAHFAFREIFSMNNVNPRFLRRTRDVATLLQQAEETQAQQELIAASQGIASAVKDVSAGIKDVSDVGLAA